MKYTVHMWVDCSIDVDVDAADPEDAYDKAKEVFWNMTSKDNLDIGDAKPIFITDDSGELVREY